MIRAWALLALLASGCGTRECKNGTVFLTVTLSGAALAATLVEVEAQVEGGEYLNGNFMVKQLGGGTVEIDFPAGYPEGKNVTLHVSAAAGAARLATSRLAFVAIPGCTPLAITVGGEDGGACDPGATHCSEDSKSLLTCNADAVTFDPTPCATGCRSVGGPAHCAVLEPSGTADPSDYSGTAVLTIAADTVFDTDSGAITGGATRTAGAGVQDGVGFRSVSQPGSTVRLGVFSLAGLTLAKGATLTVSGSSPLVIVSGGDVTLDGKVDLTGDCAVPPTGGGGAGGTSTVNNGDGLGTRGGRSGGGGLNAASGGGGGGYGDAGGRGGNGGGGGAAGGAGGAGFGNLTSEPLVLVGGSGGGAGGAGNAGGFGGKGGGALQIAANGTLTVSGTLVASGCGGRPGGAQAGGGGGGAGGTLLLEAATLHLTATAILAVNGGGGGGASGGQPGMQGGANGTLTPAGTGGTGGTAGGTGGAKGRVRGAQGVDGANSAGGGGGAAGRIGMKTQSGSVTDDGALLSPARADMSQANQPATTLNIATFQ